MQGAGIQIEKALRTFTKEVWPGIVAMVSDMTPKDMQWCLWYAKSYKKTLKALMKLHDFAGDNSKADSYICGYYRGLQMAAFRLRKRQA
jgi:hypothetical protein